MPNQLKTYLSSRKLHESGTYKCLWYYQCYTFVPAGLPCLQKASSQLKTAIDNSWGDVVWLMRKWVWLWKEHACFQATVDHFLPRSEAVLHAEILDISLSRFSHRELTAECNRCSNEQNSYSHSLSFHRYLCIPTIWDIYGSPAYKQGCKKWEYTKTHAYMKGHKRVHLGRYRVQKITLIWIFRKWTSKT